MIHAHKKHLVEVVSEKKEPKRSRSEEESGEASIASSSKEATESDPSSEISEKQEEELEEAEELEKSEEAPTSSPEANPRLPAGPSDPSRDPIVKWMIKSLEHVRLPPRECLPPKLETTQKTWEETIFDPETNTTFNISTGKRGGKLQLAFLESPMKMPGAKTPASVRRARYNELVEKEFVIKTKEEHELIFCPVHGGLIPIESADADHLQAKAAIREHQYDLITKMNVCPEIVKLVMAQKGAEKFFIRHPFGDFLVFSCMKLKDSISDIKHISEAKKKPVLIKDKNGSIHVYGCTKSGEWKLTRLDSSNFEKIDFPKETGGFQTLESTKISKAMFEEIASKDAHGKYFGTEYFYRLYFNDISNIWLICSTCNSKKSDVETLSWLEEQWPYGRAFSEYLKKDPLVLEQAKTRGMADVALEWFFKHHSAYCSITKRIFKEIEEPLKLLSQEVYLVVNSGDSPQKAKRLHATLDARVDLAAAVMNAKIGMPPHPSEPPSQCKSPESDGGGHLTLPPGLSLSFEQIEAAYNATMAKTIKAFPIELYELAQETFNEELKKQKANPIQSWSKPSSKLETATTSTTTTTTSALRPVQ